MGTNVTHRLVTSHGALILPPHELDGMGQRARSEKRAGGEAMG